MSRRVYKVGAQPLGRAFIRHLNFLVFSLLTALLFHYALEQPQQHHSSGLSKENGIYLISSNNILQSEVFAPDPDVSCDLYLVTDYIIGQATKDVFSPNLPILIR